MRKTFNGFLIFLISLLTTSTTAQLRDGMTSGEISLAFKKLGTIGSVLYVAAHPDDENTRLLSYLANEKKFRTIYLSITRGDGGQNLIGNEQGEELGMIRTRELLEARNIDGAEQFFTRANDFGFSKNPEETFQKWNKDSVLADVVWAIRKFKPDVIINRFPTTGEGGHGHHTASAILAVEAFRAAADPKKFPEQLKYVSTWQAKRIFQNSFIPRGQPTPDYSNYIKQDVGGYNTLLGLSYGEMAAASRSMHKSQGFGVAASRGNTIEYFKKLDGDTVVTELFEGVMTNWTRFKNGSIIDSLINKAANEFIPEEPQKSVPALLDILEKIKILDDPYWKEIKEKEVIRLIAACSGLWMEVNAKNYNTSPGDTIPITFSIIARQLAGLQLNKISFMGWDSLPLISLSKNEMLNISKTIRVDSSIPYSNPYWLNQPHENGMYHVADPSLIGVAWNNDNLNAQITFSINGKQLNFSIPVTHKWPDPVKGELIRSLEIIPAVSISPSEKILVFTKQESKNFQVQLHNHIDSISGVIKVVAPEGWKVDKQSIPVTLIGRNKKKTFEFTLEPSKNQKTISGQNLQVEIIFEANGKKFDQKITNINYDHIPRLSRLKKSIIKIVNIDLVSNIKKIGYIEGAGDDVAECLQLAGFDVTILDEQKIMKEPLTKYDAILTGIRAYNTIENMDIYYQPLMKYVEDGGNLVVQYNTSNFISNLQSNLGPYPFKITRDRVTVENAPVTFKDPGNALLNSPNKINQNDFDNWIQERGLYFAGELAPEYKTILTMNDPGETVQEGSIIITKYGKGNFIYTGISFFRQLPAGVPGAYRLLVNLLNAGK